MAANDDVRNNTEESRYELSTPDGLALAVYDERGGALRFTHTEVPPSAAGKGVGSRLIAGALADVRRRDLKIVPLCSFVAAYLDRHPDQQDLLASDAPG